MACRFAGESALEKIGKNAMKIAYTLASGRGKTNLLLADLAANLSAEGLKLCGTVQVDSACGADERCDMDVKVLPDGPLIRISQSLGRESRGCRLDPDALEQAVGLTETELARGADLMIINKFGKHEADGRGFRDTIATALAMDIPVVVGANKLNLDAFLEFCEGLAMPIEPDVNSLRDWALEAVGGAIA